MVDALMWLLQDARLGRLLFEFGFLPADTLTDDGEVVILGKGSEVFQDGGGDGVSAL